MATITQGCESKYHAKLTTVFTLEPRYGSRYNVTVINYFTKVDDALDAKVALDNLIASKMVADNTPNTIFTFTALPVDSDTVYLSDTIGFPVSEYRGHHSTVVSMGLYG